jgi:hypothetical protein
MSLLWTARSWPRSSVPYRQRDRGLKVRQTGQDIRVTVAFPEATGHR